MDRSANQHQVLRGHERLKHKWREICQRALHRSCVLDPFSSALDFTSFLRMTLNRKMLGSSETNLRNHLYQHSTVRTLEIQHRLPSPIAFTPCVVFRVSLAWKALYSATVSKIFTFS